MVTQSLEAKHYENTQASFTYTHDSWEEITRERDRLHPELDIVGWYHTHPDFGVFLSGHDLFIHQHFFAQPLQVAYVVDPIRQTRGFFQWRESALVQVGGFFLMAGRGERQALARLVNDLESIPNTDGGGGGLSPRLEAELLAMLTRTSHPQATTNERTLTAALFGLLGMMAGAVLVLALLWLVQLNRSLQDQAERIDQIAQSVDRSSAAQRLALETLLAKSASAETANDPDAFLTQYRKTSASLDEARDKLEQQATINGELATKVQRPRLGQCQAQERARPGEDLRERRQGSRQAPREGGRPGDREQETGQQARRPAGGARSGPGPRGRPPGAAV